MLGVIAFFTKLRPSICTMTLAYRWKAVSMGREGCNSILQYCHASPSGETTVLQLAARLLSHGILSLPKSDLRLVPNSHDSQALGRLMLCIGDMAVV